MNPLPQHAPEFMRRLMRLLRWRVWSAEKLHFTEWQTTLLWAALAGFLGAMVSLLFSGMTEGIHEFLTGSSAGVVESMRQLPWWGCIAVPAAGGLLAGLVLQFGRKLSRRESSTDYMEAIVIGSGRGSRCRSRARNRSSASRTMPGASHTPHSRGRSL